MGQQEELAAVLKPPAAVVFSWEPVAVTTKPAAAEARGDTIVMPPGSPTKKAAAAPPARRLSVPPPPGRAATRSLSSRAGGQAVRPEDDPFLAAYLACTKSSRGGSRDAGAGAGGTPGEGKQGRSRFTWARLGLSCKSSAGVVERSMVKVAKRPELDPRDA